MPRAANPDPVAAEHSASPANLFVGTSGWAYPSWKPGFYPKNVPARSFLQYYASQLSSVEVNYTFRMLPSASQLDSWLAAVPHEFRFSFKAPQRITHFSRLRDCEAAVDEFLLALEPVRAAGKLGSLLFQLPPNFGANSDRLANFLAHSSLRAPQAPRLAFEFRHSSWFAEPIFALLRASNAALCVAESEDLVTPDIGTATHRYYRLRRPGGYRPATLRNLAAKYATLAAEGDVFVYHKHEDEPTGALNARSLLTLAAKAAKGPKVSTDLTPVKGVL